MNDRKIHINGTRRGLGKALERKYGNFDLQYCNTFINCKHDAFLQVDLLYKAVELEKQVINIGSYASDWIYHPYKSSYKYSIEKNALRNANSQLFDNGHNVTCINFGYFDTERSKDIHVEKMSLEYVIEIIEWVLAQPYRIKEITVTP